MKNSNFDESQINRIDAILGSMTLVERNNHNMMNGSRKLRIAKGSGTRVSDVNRLLKQFVQMRKMMKTVSGRLAGVSRGRKKGRKHHIELPAMEGVGLLGR